MAGAYAVSVDERSCVARNVLPADAAVDARGVPQRDVLRHRERRDERVTLAVLRNEPDFGRNQNLTCRGRESSRECEQQLMMPGAFDSGDSQDFSRTHADRGRTYTDHAAPVAKLDVAELRNQETGFSRRGRRQLEAGSLGKHGASELAF